MSVSTKEKDYKAIPKGGISTTFVVFLATLAVFLVCAFDIPQRMPFYQTTDAFRSFFQAYTVLGYDWSEIAGVIGYGSFGFGLVFVLPLAAILRDNTVAVYRAVLCINALFPAAMVPMTYYLLQYWGAFRENNGKVFKALTLLFFTATPLTLVYGRTELIETLLMLLGLAIVCVFSKTQQKNASLRWFVTFGVLLAYLYCVHNRAIGICGAACLCFLLLVLVRKINWKQGIVFFASFIVPMIVVLLIKRWVQASLYGYSDVGFGASDVGNDATLGYMLQRIWLALNNLRGVMIGASGKYWGISSVSYFLVTAGILAGVILYVDILCKKTYLGSFSETLKEMDYSVFFVCFAFIALFVEITVANSSGDILLAGSRAEGLFYTRYNNIVYLPLSIYGFAYLMSHKQKWIVAGLTIILGVANSFTTLYLLKKYLSRAAEGTFFNPVPQIIGFREIGIGYYCVLTVSVFVLLAFFSPKGWRRFLSCAAMAVGICFSAYTVYEYMNEEINPQIRQSINLYSGEVPTETVLYYTGNDKEHDYWQINGPRIQYALPNLRIERSNELIPGSKSIIPTMMFFTESVSSLNLNVINAGRDFSYVEVLPGYSQYIELPLSIWDYRRGIVPDNDFVMTDGVEGHFMWLNYNLRSTEANASISFDLELLSSVSDKIVIGEVYSVTKDTQSSFMKPIASDLYTPLMYVELGEEDFVDGKYRLSLNLDNISGKINIRLYAYEDAVIKVNTPMISNNENVVPFQVFKSQWGQNSGEYYISDGFSEGYLMYCDTLYIDKGEHTFTVKGSLQGVEKEVEVVGNVDFLMRKADIEDQVIQGVEILKSDFIDGEVEISVPLSIKDEMDSCELRIWASSGAVLMISEIKLSSTEVTP